MFLAASILQMHLNLYALLFSRAKVLWLCTTASMHHPKQQRGSPYLLGRVQQFPSAWLNFAFQIIRLMATAMAGQQWANVKLTALYWWHYHVDDWPMIGQQLYNKDISVYFSSNKWTDREDLCHGASDPSYSCESVFSAPKASESQEVSNKLDPVVQRYHPFFMKKTTKKVAATSIWL